METGHSGSDLGNIPVSTIQLRLAAGAVGGNASLNRHKAICFIDFIEANARHIYNNQK